MVWAVLALVFLCWVGFVDLRSRKIPIWMILVNAGLSILLAAHHPLTSFIVFGLSAVLLARKPIGTADKYILPFVACAFSLWGIMLILLATLGSWMHIRIRKTDAPMLFYLAVGTIIFVGVRGIGA